MVSGEVDVLGRSSVWKMQGERVIKYAKHYEKNYHLDGNLEKYKDIMNHEEGTKTCESQCTINIYKTILLSVPQFPLIDHSEACLWVEPLTKG